ncbi:unnamed protein product [Brachionus calyciflorus]|uniref:Protein-tyrosine sulfotransferase n=1 Tax=Brachionus calyciflorus TaxID=104777 RepID=A0A813M3W1_9BILA|nr:unnamed protein product [Brachionus calyciflorus]
MIFLLRKKKLFVLLFLISLVIFFYGRNLTIKKSCKYDLESIRKLPIIFIGGYGRSGTTLVRAILDTHPNIKCGPETKIIPSLLSFMQQYTSSKLVMEDLKSAGIDSKLIENSIAEFIHHIIKYRNIKRSERLCIKDPDILRYIEYLNRLFPNAKFIHVIRDGRVAAYSFMKKVKQKLIFKNFRSYLSSWNSYNELIVKSCSQLENNNCYRLLTWHGDLLEHEKHLNKIKISNREWSSNQIVNSIYKNSSSNSEWATSIKNYDHYSVYFIAPMLRILGYNVSVFNDSSKFLAYKKMFRNKINIL